MIKHAPPKYLSALLVAVGLLLMVSGVISQIHPAPSADEQVALKRGEQVSAAMTVTPNSEARAPSVLPAPGAASLPSGSTAGAQPEEGGQSGQSQAPSPADPTAPPPPPTDTPQVQQLNTGIPTRIVAPSINLDTKVDPVGWVQANNGGQVTSQWDVPNYAAGFLKSSALPGTGNTVLDGHHNIYGQVFRYVVNLEKGDQIDLYVGDQEFTYQVTDKLILLDAGVSMEQRIKNAQWIAPTQDDRLTLVTCWPYWTNTHRLIVVAKPVGSNGTSPQPASASAP